MKNISMLFLASAALVIGLGLLALRLRPDAQRVDQDQAMVRIYCAAGVAKPVEKIIQAYNDTYQARIEIVRTGGSGELAGQIKTEFETGLVGGADLYITADRLLLNKAFEAGIIAERFQLAQQRPVIATAVDCEFEITSMNDLVTQEIKYGIASERAAVGKLARSIADRYGILSELEANKATDAENVMTLAQALTTGSIDAAIMWDTTVNQINQTRQINGTSILKISALADPADKAKSNIAAGVMTSTRTPTSCLRFLRFLTGSQTARDSFQEFGFTFIQGDEWEEVPEIHLYCGSMFTPVLEESVREFAKREGINMYPRWQGCGKLVASMEGTKDAELFPDAFLACDDSFLVQVQGHFSQATSISSNDIVIAVRNQDGIDVTSAEQLLSNSELRFGICDPDQSALGRLTKRIWESYDSPVDYEQLSRQAAVTVDVGPTLISQLMSGGLDAAIVYRSNVVSDASASQQLTIVEIESDLARARQAWAVAKTSRNPELMNRFFVWMHRREVADRFQRFGFSSPESERP